MKYHSKTFELLKLDKRFNTSKTPTLAEMDTLKKESDLPESYLEWYVMEKELGWFWEHYGKHNILHFYSNTDKFWISPDSIWKDNDEYLYEGKRILVFASESQGNFLLGILLDGSNDPKVMFTDYTRKIWVEYAESFSTCIFTQIFDWQFQLTGGPPDWDTDLSYDYLKLESGAVPEVINKLKIYKQESTTQYLYEGISYTNYRFSVSPLLRLVVTTSKEVNGITITCKSNSKVFKLKEKIMAELL